MGNEEGEACEKCKHTCLLIHGKNRKQHSSASSSPSPIISFFKIMIGDKFSQFLYLPPKFGRTVSNLVGQKVYLEDSNGRQWGVTVSKINGSVAFKQGWNAFSLDHGLKVGEFLMFHYVTGSHFVVHIFDKTGCEKHDFSEERGSPKKRPRTDNNFMCNVVPCHTSDKSSMNKQSSSSTGVSKSDIEMNQSQCDVNNVDNVPMDTKNTSNCVPMGTKNTSNCVNSNGRSLPELKADYMAESCLMINRDLLSSIFDLSNFEMRCNASVADQSNGPLAGTERSSLQGDVLLDSKIKAASVGTDPVAVEVPSRESPSNAFQFQTNETNDDFGSMPKISSKCDEDPCNKEITENILPTSAAKPVENRKDCPDMSKKVIKRCWIADQRKNTSTEPLYGDNQVDVSQKDQTPCSGGSPNVQPEVTGVSKFSEFSVPCRLQNTRNDARLMAVKQELAEMTPGHCSSDEMIQGKEPNAMKGAQGQSFNLTIKDSYKSLKVVKTEAIDTDDWPSSIATSVSCLVEANNQSYLELPACLPLVSFKGRMKADGKVLFLKDPVMRLWPVVYHERYNFKILTRGWEAFSTANSIQQGDECLFEVESAPDGIYKVSIIRRF